MGPHHPGTHAHGTETALEMGRGHRTIGLVTRGEEVGGGRGGARRQPDRDGLPNTRSQGDRESLPPLLDGDTPGVVGGDEGDATETPDTQPRGEQQEQEQAVHGLVGDGGVQSAHLIGREGVTTQGGGDGGAHGRRGVRGQEGPQPGGCATR